MSERELLTVNDTQHHNNPHNQHLSGCLRMLMWMMGVVEWNPPETATWEKGACERIRGLATFKRRLAFVTSMLFHILMIILSVVSFGVYLYCYFAKVDHFLRFVSFMCYWPPLVSAQIICLTAVVNKYTRRQGEFSCFNIFDESSCTRKLVSFKRSMIIPLPKLGHFICVFVFFPTLYTSLKLAAFLRKSPVCVYPLEYIWLFSRVLSGIYFGVFCYFLYLQRVFMKRQGDKAALFISEHVGDLEKCFDETRAFFKEYYELRTLILPWFSLIMFTSSFGFTVFVTWNYEIRQFVSNGTAATLPETYSHIDSDDYQNGTHFCIYTCDEDEWVQRQPVLLSYNILIISRNLVISILPCFVVKGMDLVYVWNRFRMKVNFMYSAKDREFWKHLMTFIDQLHPSTTFDLIFSFVFPLVGFASGLLSGKHF